MRVHKPKSRDTIWRIEFVSPQAPQASIAAKLTSFAAHKTELLGILRATYQRGTMTKSFNANKSWEELTRIAEFYFKEAEFRQKAVPVARRIKRLRQIANALGRAGNLIDKTVGGDLFKGWCAEANIRATSYIFTGEAGSVLTRVADKIEDAVANLSALERAARRAGDDMRPSRGRPKGTVVLPPDCVRALAAVYQASTGLKPGKGKGPFARFVYAFLTAVGQRVLAYQSIVDTIKSARL
jgi:hypothetical protein